VLPHKWLLFFSFWLLLSAFAVSVVTSHDVYQYQVWPYILIVLGLTFLRHLFFVLGALLDELRRYSLEKKLQLRSNSLPTISIIMPAYNEAQVVKQSLRHLSLLRYPNFEIIFVDDGSTDETLQIAENTAQEISNVRIKILTKINGGKASALNYGIAHASGELIMCVDADSRLHPESLLAGAKHFIDPKTGAVAGFVEIENQDNLLLNLQQLEYLTSLNFLRKAYSVLGIVPIVPGPVGMFRRSALTAVGCFSSDRHIFAEDAELSLRLISKGWKIHSEEGMLAFTEAPANWKAFFRQRYRWNRGTFQALEINFSKMTLGRFNPISNFLAIHLLLETWITPVMNIMVIFNFVSRLFLHQEVHLFTIWIAFGLFIDLWVVIMATYKTRRLFWGFRVLIFNKLFYENILFFWKLFCLFDELMNRKMSWDKLERQGNLQEVQYGK